MYKATTLISAAFEGTITHHAFDAGPLSVVEAGFTGENTTFMLRFINSDDDMDVRVLTEDLATVPDHKRAAVLEVVNNANNTYKYAKWCLTPKGKVTAEYDFPVSLSEDNTAKVAVEIALRFAKIVDDVYPDIMRAIYA